MEKHKIFKAFSNEVRLKVFEFLLEGKMCVSGIVNKLNVTQPTVTQHLKILQEIYDDMFHIHMSLPHHFVLYF